MEPLVGTASRERPVGVVLARLPAVRKVASGWLARCPSHEDQRPSLSISERDDGAALIFCHAGCPADAIVAVLGLTLADLFPPQPAGRSRIVATYDYPAADGRPLHQVVRLEPKAFRQRRWTGNGWAWGLAGIDPVLYQLAELIVADPLEPLVIVEGEKDADRLSGLGFTATTNPGGAGKWRMEYGEWLRGRSVVIVPDNDGPGRSHAMSIAQGLAGVAAAVRILELPGLAQKGDVSDWLDKGGTRDRLLELIASTLPMVPEGARVLPRLMPSVAPEDDSISLSPPVATLGETLDALVSHLTRFLHFARPEHAHAIALWASHTHAPLERLAQSPILAVTSAVKQSGKTKLLDLLEHIVRDPWRVIRPSEAVLFRKIDADHPTVLLDEIDAIFNDRGSSTEGIRALFNSGNRKGTRVPRAVAQGRTFALVEFDVFSPKATAGIGGLPDTILDRAIVIPMQRRAPGERVERLRERQAKALGQPLREALAYHVSQIHDFIVDDELLPPELDERAQDGWESLFAIAAIAGGAWPGLARSAALAVFGTRRPRDDSHELRLLDDVRHAFSNSNAPDFLATAELREGLIAMEESPWADVRGKPITPHYLAKVLGRFDVGSKRHRPFGIGNPVHGYYRADLVDAWHRYLDAESGTSGTSGTPGPRAEGPASENVPDVPDVRDVGQAKLTPWQVPSDDEWIVGTA